MHKVKKFFKTLKAIYRKIFHHQDEQKRKRARLIGWALLGIFCVLVLWGLYAAIWGAPKQVYSVAVMVRSQQIRGDKVEDRKNSLKTGDVMNIKAADHNWSKVERVSYLILKMELTEKQKERLMAPEEREIKFKELSEEEQQRIEEEKQRAKDNDEEYYEEQRTETLRKRAYAIDFDYLRKKYREFEDFKAIDLLNIGQPFGEDMVFDWGIVEKKESVLD